MFGKSREVFVYNETKGTFLAFKVRVADSILGRLIGLLGKRSLKPDAGVWIVPANAIHTFGMLFSFDVVMVDKNFRVVSVTELLKPFHLILPKRHAESVFELPAHTIFRSRTEVGDQLLIDRYEAVPTAAKKVDSETAAKVPSRFAGASLPDRARQETPDSAQVVLPEASIEFGSSVRKETETVQ